MADCLQVATTAQIRPVAQATVALCRAVAAGREAGEPNEGEWGLAVSGIREPPGVVIRRHIEEHLATVDVGGLVARFGLSRRSLYRLFTPEGGVEAYIRDRRLARARQELTRPRIERRPKLARIAHTHGFSDPRVFSRAFQRRYGVSPMAIEPGPAEQP